MGLSHIQGKNYGAQNMSFLINNFKSVITVEVSKRLKQMNYFTLTCAPELSTNLDAMVNTEQGILRVMILCVSDS